MTRQINQAVGEASPQLPVLLEGSRPKPIQAQLQELVFDPEKLAAAPELIASIKSLWALLRARTWQNGLQVRELSLTQRKAFMSSLDAIACNLAWLMMTAPDGVVAVPDHSKLGRARSRYKPVVYGEAFVELLDVMASPELGLIEYIQRGFEVGKHSQPSLIRPLPAFGEQVPVALLTWESFTRLPPREVLILKRGQDQDDDALALSYTDTDRTQTMRKEVTRLNKRLLSLPIILKGLPGEVPKNHLGLPIDPTKRTLRRIFNNRSFDEGGRLYGTFWERMTWAMRFDYLRLPTHEHPEGEPIAHVDFEQLFVHLAYHRAGRVPPDGDLFDIEGNGRNRMGWKSLINAQLFAKPDLKRWPPGCLEAFERAIPFKKACAMLAEKHWPIAYLFGTGIGFKVMFKESSTLILVLDSLHSEGIAALPLHDSVLVPRSRAERARELIQAVMNRTTNKSCPSVSIDFGPEQKGA